MVYLNVEEVNKQSICMKGSGCWNVEQEENE